jgi:hypothetical protein
VLSWNAHPSLSAGSRCVTAVAAIALLVLQTASAESEEEASPFLELEQDAPKADSAQQILAAQPEAITQRLFEEKLIVMQEVRESNSDAGRIITALVIFEKPREDVYDLLSQTTRAIEFRPSVTKMATVGQNEYGPIDEHQLSILFRTYVYRLEYRLEPENHRFSWTLDQSFDNDLRQVDGWWDLYAMEDGRTLGRSGTIVDVGPAVPGFLQDWITRKNIPGTMKHVRGWVESDGEYRP